MKKLISGIAIILTAIIYFMNKKQKHYENNIIKKTGHITVIIILL